MKVNYYKDDSLLENRVDIFYKKIDSEISGVMEYLNSYDFILGRNEDLTKKIYPNEILYIEVVERRVYYSVCTKSLRSLV